MSRCDIESDPCLGSPKNNVCTFFFGSKAMRIAVGFLQFDSLAAVDIIKELCAQNRTRTCTPRDIRTWNVRVYQFRHLGILEKYSRTNVLLFFWAANETRTRDPDLGKVVLYQLSYCRKLLNHLLERLSDFCQTSAQKRMQKYNKFFNFPNIPPLYAQFCLFLCTLCYFRFANHRSLCLPSTQMLCPLHVFIFRQPLSKIVNNSFSV